MKVTGGYKGSELKDRTIGVRSRIKMDPNLAAIVNVLQQQQEQMKATLEAFAKTEARPIPATVTSVPKSKYTKVAIIACNFQIFLGALPPTLLE